jgi:hypothetical protein
MVRSGKPLAIVSGLVALCPLLLVLGPSPASAQGWTLEAGGGQTSFEATPTGEWFGGVTLGARYAGLRHNWFHAAVGVPVGSDALPWAAVGGGGRLDVGSLSTADLGIRGSAHAYGYRSPALDFGGGGVTAEVLPSLIVPLGRALRAELQAGAMMHAADDGGVAYSNVLQENRLDLQLRPGGFTGLAIALNGRYSHGRDGAFPFVGGAVSIAPTDGLALRVDAGQWLSEALPTTRFGADVSLRVAQRAHLSVGYAQDPGHPLYWNEPRRGWHATVAIGVGTPPRSPVTRVMADVQDGRAIFRLPGRYAESAAYVAGDFTGWERVAMQREGNDWVARLSVPSGVHHYAFVDGEGNWIVPADLPQVDDGMGGRSAVLVVP